MRPASVRLRASTILRSYRASIYAATARKRKDPRCVAAGVIVKP